MADDFDARLKDLLERASGRPVQTTAPPKPAEPAVPPSAITYGLSGGWQTLGIGYHTLLDASADALARPPVRRLMMRVATIYECRRVAGATRLSISVSESTVAFPLSRRLANNERG